MSPTDQPTGEPEGPSPSKGYTIVVDSNSRFMDEDERYRQFGYATYEEAFAECVRIVEEFLVDNHRPGMSPNELLSIYRLFGESPWVENAGQRPRFSGRDYAEHRCEEICGRGA